MNLLFLHKIVLKNVIIIIFLMKAFNTPALNLIHVDINMNIIINV